MGDEKNNGIYYTPADLAEFAARISITSPHPTLLDPAFGEGALLLAARKRLLMLKSRKPKTQLYGYDILPAKKAITEACDKGYLLRSNLFEKDFFAVSCENQVHKYDVILMNPPFVRHHLISEESQQTIRNALAQFRRLPLTSDLYSYFIIYSLGFLRNNGKLAAILPWSFLNADFAISLRRELLDHFRQIKVLVIGERLFPKVEERVLVLLCDGFGKKTEKISLDYSFSLPRKLQEGRFINRDTWLQPLWRHVFSAKTTDLIMEAKNKYGFCPLSEYADIRIGTVTGANNFFIIDKETSKKLNVPRRFLKPILRHSGALRNLSTSAYAMNDFLLSVPKTARLPGELSNYFNKGKKDGINNRYHTKKRKPWYSLPKQHPPDAFLHYMTKEVPFIVLNDARFLSTNTIHNIFFNDDVEENARKWIQLSMLTSVSQLSIELTARTYGGGVLKIEPSAAKNILVYLGQGRTLPDEIEEQLNLFLKTGNYKEALEYADQQFKNRLRLPDSYLVECRKHFDQLRAFRLGLDAKKSET